jgi:hypothetical protein
VNGSFNHAFLIGGMQMMIHIQEFTSLRIPCTTTPSVETGCFPYFFTRSFINVSAIMIVLSKEI